MTTWVVWTNDGKHYLLEIELGESPETLLARAVNRGYLRCFFVSLGKRWDGYIPWHNIAAVVPLIEQEREESHDH